MNPSFDICSIDVVTDRNNVRKLLSFVDPSSNRNGLEPFTINMEVVKGTAILCRAETVVQETIGPHEFRGYGHEFEKAYTSDQIHDSIGHHRIISYRLGSLSFIVRHETDGCIDVDTAKKFHGIKSREDDLSQMLGSLSLSSSNASSRILLWVQS